MCSATKKKPKKPVELLQKPVDYNRSVSGSFCLCTAKLCVLVLSSETPFMKVTKIVYFAFPLGPPLIRLLPYLVGGISAVLHFQFV